jgi:regulatory protein
MNTVTAVEAQKGQRGRVNIFVDGAFAFSLSRPLVAEVGLHTGQTLSRSDQEKLESADLVRRCREAALKYLQPRPRSEAEVTSRLRRHGFDAGTIEQVLVTLREQGLVNDSVFATFWRENREAFRPRSRRALELELKRKGVEADTVAETVAAVDDEQSAHLAAQRKARSLAGLDYPSFRRRLGMFLRRRGFAFELINHTIDQVWRERTGCQPDL